MIKVKRATALIVVASQKGHPEVAQLLIEEGADVNAKNKQGNTALKLALRERHPEVVKMLREAGAK
jgi:ankyrin repeat protein